MPLLAAPADDTTLVERYRNGDVSAFDILFRNYYARVRAICNRYVSDENAVEDLVQDTFLNVVRALPKIQGELNFSAWLSRIAVNVCQDELRRRTRRARHQEKQDDNTEEQILRLPDTDRDRHPEAALEISTMRQLVWEVAKRLPERQRMVLTLREFQGLSYASIARVMGISDSAVETLLHRARRRFREEYLHLESPPEEPNDCASLAALLRRPDQRWDHDESRFMQQHLRKCEWCREHIGPPGGA